MGVLEDPLRVGRRGQVRHISRREKGAYGSGVDASIHFGLGFCPDWPTAPILNPIQLPHAQVHFESFSDIDLSQLTRLGLYMAALT